MKRFFILGVHAVLLLFTVLYFWTQSRYPALSDKAYYGDRNRQTGISYDQVIPRADTDPWMHRVYAGTINWYYTNWKGMTFGLIFAALLLSLFNFLRLPQFRNRWLRSAMGCVTGAPLGVCVNCATPIGQGLERSGFKPESVIATTLSSPTLNVIVLSMLLAYFPLYLIVVKIAVTLAMILLIVPLIAPDVAVATTVATAPPQPKTWPETIRLLAKSLSQSALRIIILTVPMMALAGLLGATVVESVDLTGWGGASSWWKLLALSAVGTALPVPMTFDIVFSHKLLESDLPTSYVTALLVTLGMFSVYPFLVFGRAYSWRFAATLAVSVTLLGAGAGLAAEKFEEHLLADVRTGMDHRLASMRNLAFELADDGCKGSRQTECLRGLVEVAARSADLTGLCNRISDPLQRVDCQYTNDFQRGKMKLSDCAKAEDVEGCESIFYRVVAQSLELNDDLDCSAYGSEFCAETEDFLRQIRRRSHVGCGALVRGPAREVCFARTAVGDVQRRNDMPLAVKVCNRIRSSELHEQCLLQVYVKAGRRDLCAQTGDLRVKCELRTSRFTGRCKSLAEQDREECHSWMMAERVQRAYVKSEQSVALQQAAAALQDVSADEEASMDEPEWKPVAAPQLEEHAGAKSGNVALKSFALRARSPASAKQFARVWGDKFGIRPGVQSGQLSLLIKAFPRGFGMAAGDINGDQWPDLALGELDGVHIYLNKGGEGFETSRVILPGRNITPINLALVDLDNDGADDLYIANYDGRNFVVPNKNGRFEGRTAVPVGKSPRGWSISATFADLNKDGLLDVFIGKLRPFLTGEPFFQNEDSANEILVNKGAFKFEALEWKDAQGTTFSVLASDINHDGRLDLLEGNDFEATDYIHLGEGGMRFHTVKRSDNIVPTFTFGSMGFDTGDFNNDLKLDIFAAGLNRDVETTKDYCQLLYDDGLDSSFCESVFAIHRSVELQNPRACAQLADDVQAFDCYAGILTMLAQRMKTAKVCTAIPSQFYLHRARCEDWFTLEAMRRTPNPEDVPQKQRGNLLLQAKAAGGYEDVAKKLGVDNSHWAWNSKFADLDNDGWQDIYSVNGRSQHMGMGSNIYFHNLRGERFEKAQDRAGLTDFYDTTAYVYFDFDNDGDLDILSNGILVNHKMFVNSLQGGEAIRFSFDDRKGNRAGIGNKVVIHYRDGEGRPAAQLRELKSGGGHTSYDPKIVHFGLGSVKEIESVEIEWSTGGKTEIKERLAAGRHYVVQRL